MGYSNNDTGDFEKLKIAMSSVFSKFQSLDGLLEAFGLSAMPAAQRYGIMFGVLVFVFTVTAVLGLLILGGSFKRIAEQSETGEATLMSAHDARGQRALLLEQLLEGRDRMMEKYDNLEFRRTERRTPLTDMLLNEALTEVIPDLKDEKKENGSKKQRAYPPFYEENYATAYRKCRDKPGGAILPGRPEARFEAYARAFAGCGPYLSPACRRSYARMYESICCQNHATDEKYSALFADRPQDVVGRAVRLEALDVGRHLNALFQVTSGEPALENNAYDPDEVWSFDVNGPFDDANEMRESNIFQLKPNEAAFAIVHAVTDRIMGCIRLTNDDPENLTIQLEPPILQPIRQGSKEQLESCFLLIDRLFGFGYRRIQICIDSQDSDKRKVAIRLFFTLEGILYRHMIVKEANRDSSIYAMTNSDWKMGARAAIFKKLYGNLAYAVDAANEKKEAELDEQQVVLKEKRLLEGQTG